MPAPQLATVENLKVPPHSIEAEQAVLGGLLLDYGWQWLFLINVPIAVVLILGAWRLLPEGSVGEDNSDELEER